MENLLLLGVPILKHIRVGSYAYGQRSKSCLGNNSKTTEANLMKLHGKIEHNVKVCWAQELGYYAQCQGHNHVRCQIALKIRSE